MTSGLQYQEAHNGHGSVSLFVTAIAITPVWILLCMVIHSRLALPNRPSPPMELRSAQPAPVQPAPRNSPTDHAEWRSIQEVITVSERTLETLRQSR